MNGRLPADVGAVLAAVRARRPVVHCLTNEVTIGRVADALAALGALPVMASAEEEAAAMVERAQALVLNLGTPSAARWAAARSAGARAAACGVPVVVDPVGCGATPWRTAQARGLVAAVRADVVRGNAPEIAALAGLAAPAGFELRGVAAVAGGPGAGEAGAAGADQLTTSLGRLAGSQGNHVAQGALAAAASRALNATVVVSGRTDVIACGEHVLRHTGNVPALEGLVGAGDVLTAVIAACRAVAPDGIAASWAGLSLFSAAARTAADGAAGPGSFWSRLLDAFSALKPETAGRAVARVPAPPTVRGAGPAAV